jgi:hypothetical protein
MKEIQRRPKVLKLSFFNHKLSALAKFLGYSRKSVLAVNIPAGYTCAKADVCLTFAHHKTGKMRRVGRVKCYASKTETMYPATRNANWHNWRLLLACGTDINAIYNVLSTAISKKTKIVRIHSSGDMYSPEYFQAWRLLAKNNPDVMFFGYTKHLEYVLESVNNPISNFKIVYSYGSKDDGIYSERYNPSIIPTCFIEEFKGQYDRFNLKTVCGEDGEHEDYFEIISNNSFIIRIH